ncbi:hypothetical protein ABBQ38_004133 [Trebouxia sp. C0009 RCD-2024]
MEDAAQVHHLSAQVHHLPCNIEHNGSAPVTSFFLPQDTGLTVDGLNIHQAAFRGRRLKGAEIRFPSGYHGGLLQKSRVHDGPAKVSWTQHAVFDSFWYWNHDAVPMKTDPLRKCVHWLELSKHLHQPVTAEEVQQQMQQKQL